MIFEKSGGAVDWLIVGLGNPGQKYEHTRHNMGFLTVDLLAEQLNVKLNKVKFKSAYNIVRFGGQKCLVMKPQTYMNLSGEAVHEAVQFYKIPADHVLVIYDDVSLPVGKLRVRPTGSAGGHNGIKNIISPHQDRHRRPVRRRCGDDRLGHRRALSGGAEDSGGEF